MCVCLCVCVCLCLRVFRASVYFAYAACVRACSAMHSATATALAGLAVAFLTTGDLAVARAVTAMTTAPPVEVATTIAVAVVTVMMTARMVAETDTRPTTAGAGAIVMMTDEEVCIGVCLCVGPP